MWWRCPLSAGNSLRAFLGDGHGAFQDPVDSPISNGAVGLVIADFDGNGQLDAAVTTGFGTSGASVLALSGHGDGTFGAEHDYGLGQASPASISLVAADLNGDGHQDLAFCSANINTVSVLLGAGNGTFASPKTYGTGANSSPAFMAVGDLSGWGRQARCGVQRQLPGRCRPAGTTATGPSAPRLWSSR